MFGPSSINWCELDYVKSAFISEYWNTLTGLFICASSIYCYFKNKGYTNLYYSNVLLFVVGIGTMMFHSTLIYIWQLFDEIPMILIVIEYYRILTNELFFIHYTNLTGIDYRVMHYSIPVIILSYYIHPHLQVFLFQGTLGLYIANLIYTCYTINKNLNKIFYRRNSFNYVDKVTYKSQNTASDAEIKYKRKRVQRKTHILYGDNNHVEDITNSINEFKKYTKVKSHIKYHNRQGLFLLVFSLIIWNIDNYWCQHDIELHAIWHITTSLGMYSCNEIIRSYLLLNKQLVQKE